MKVEKAKYDFLSAGGEMGKLIREKDWSATALGNPEQWAPTLKTMVSVLLENPFPMYIAWGKENIQIYNDAYRPILGSTKHPQALGNSTKETFAEIWDIIKPMFDGVMQGIPVSFREMMFVLNRHGYDEECYFDFAYSPIRIDDGEVGGALVTLVETTSKKNFDLEVKELNNQLEFAIEATELATFDLDPISNKFSSNSRLKEWFGLPKQIDIELTNAIDAIAEKDRERVIAAIKNAMDFESGGNYNIDYTILNLVTKEERVVRAKGKTWFNEEKIAIRFNGTLQDISEQHFAELEKQKLIAIIEASDEYIGLTGIDTSMQYINPAGLKMLGWESYEGRNQIEGIYPPDRDLALKLLPTFFEKESISHEIRFWNEKTGVPFWVQWNGVSIKDANGNKSGKLATVSPNITDRKLAEEKLKISERDLKLMILQAPFAITVFRGPEHLVEIINSKSLEISGKKENEVLNKPLLETVPEIMGQGIKEILDNVYNTGQGYSITEYPLQLFRGGNLETVYLNFRFEPLFDAAGNENGIMSVGFDVTELVMSRKGIELGEQKLNLIIDATELGIWEFNVKTKVAEISDRCVEILGFKGEKNMEHSRMLDNFHLEDLNIRKDAFEKAFKTGHLHYKARVNWKDNSVHWMEAKGKVFYDSNNEPETMLGTVEDITEEKSFQQELLDREQKFRLLADSMPQFIWTADPFGNLNYFNQSVFDFTGLSLDDINERGWIDVVHPEEREENIDIWLQSIETGRDFLFEHRFRRADGTYRWQLSRAIPQKSEDGTIQMWVGTSTDIQDQKVFASNLESQVLQRTKQLEQKNIDLEKMNKELQSFAYISSHDLQEPLRKIQMFASRIIDKEKSNLSEFGKDHFDRIQKSAHRMQNLIEDLLAYSRTNLSDKRHDLVQLDSIINEIERDLMEELDQSTAKIIVESSCEVRVIYFQFRQLFNNLISNSLKFAKPGVNSIITITSKIDWSENLNCAELKKGMRYCHIRYADNGIGFEQQYSKKIFELFQRLTVDDNLGGTGIGLAIVKKIIDNHFGYITASSEPNEGAIFDIYIPYD